MVRFCLEKCFWGTFVGATSRAKVVVYRPSSGSGRRILFHRRLDMSALVRFYAFLKIRRIMKIYENIEN